MGTPVVAWDWGGVAEWHPGGPTLVPWGDEAGLASALRGLDGRRVWPPGGFEREALTDRLLDADARVLDRGGD